jgi:valyl-tRNA synthetase
MPYVTEEIWQNLIRTVPEVSRDQDSIMVSKYPEVDLSLIDLESELKMTKIFEIIKTIRNIRAELNITPSREIEVFILCEEDKDFIFAESSSIKSLARLSNLNILSKEDPQPESKTSVTTILDKVSVIVPFMDLLDPELEITRLSEEITSLDKRITSISQRLSNDSFKNKAPQNVIDKESERLKESKEKIEALKEQREKFL